jgi:MSHA biogenesis protein MshN
VSLINQVLKDLEQRHAREMAEATDNLDGLALASSIQGKSAKTKYWLFSLLGVGIIAGAIAIWWWQQTRSTLVTPVATSPQTAPLIPTAQVMPTPPPASVQIPAQPVIAQPVDTAPVHPTTGDKPVTAAVTAPVAHAKSKHTSKGKHPSAMPSEAVGGIEKQRVPLRREQKAELAYQAGYEQLAQHNVRRAEQELQQALSIDPTHVRARELLAGILIKQGRWIETADVMQQGVAQLPGNLVFVKLYARTLMQLNRDQQALTLLRDHAPPLAQDPDYYALMAALYQRRQNHLAAATTYSQILKLNTDVGIWWVGLGISLEALGKQQEAQQAYARARQTGSLQGDLARYTDNRLLALDAIKYPIE